MKEKVIENHNKNVATTQQLHGPHHHGRRRSFSHQQSSSFSTPYSDYHHSSMPTTTTITRPLSHRNRREMIAEDDAKDSVSTLSPSDALQENIEQFQHQFQYSNTPPGKCKF